ncbi:MAG: ribonuclease III [Myxococcales bacterium]|nr:ribonuclease III [Myxococcales bacterium]MDH5307656.1 ribonuclease III [Myxococcales bacterium]MDH5566561.1 ribonuclease III [Myxococcales bacterium]
MSEAKRGAMHDAGAVDALCGALGYAFRDRSLAALALAHPSHAHEVDGSRGNERLEFLGDAVLDLAIARRLYDLHPDWTEGKLTRARAALVNKQMLAARSRALGLDALVQLGRTEQRTAGHEKDSVLANCFEAVMGAVYLDGGVEAADALVERCFAAALRENVAPRDAKTAFQEWAHAELQSTPTYLLVHDSGVDDDDMRFRVEVRIGGAPWGTGVGRTKRAAERAAAQVALERCLGGGT